MIDWLFTVSRPAQEFFTNMETSPLPVKGCKIGAQGLWAGRDLYHATPTVTRDLGFSGLIRRTAPYSRLQGMWRIYSNPGPHGKTFWRIDVPFVQKLLRDNNKKLAVSFNHTFRYTDDVLSINNHNSTWYPVYPDELEIKDTKESNKSASYYLIQCIYSNDRLTTTLYDRRDDFDFAIVNFPFLCSNILLSPACGVYISQLIWYARPCFAYGDFSKQVKVLKLMFQGYNESFKVIISQILLSL
jgi:hypothetical protein